MLYAALKSRSFTLVPARKASSETTIMQSLILRKFLSFILSLQARTRGRAAIHGRVAAMQKNVALKGQGPAGLKPGDLLNPLRGSKEPLFHVCAGADGVIRNDHSANPEDSRA